MLIITDVTLSIIIVNYNVKFFLEQCLCSVKKAIGNIEAEVIVVDNNSIDGSIDYLKPKFHWVKFIINEKNEGFAKANNLALALAKSKYVLFLNPDTIISEDSFEKCLSFMEAHPDAGAIGVKMINGCGSYLKESKRGFPSPWVAFCKLSGLTALFPRSKFFAGYYLGYLSDNKNQIIDVISGAFFFVRKNVLDNIGGFDERFFMYAEDIDLSFRIQHAGYVNHYLAGTTVIHFKGESTKKDFHHVKLFYNAMSLFVQKHFGRKKSSVLIVLIDAAIEIRRLLSQVINFMKTKEPKKNSYLRKISITGDFKSKEKIKILLSANKIMPSEREDDADEIIFCEGEDFSFKKIIENIQQRRKNLDYGFHSGNSDSVVGSNHKNILNLYP